MTANDIAYMNYVESVRANKAREEENRRANSEIIRANLAKEQENIKARRSKTVVDTVAALGKWAGPILSLIPHPAAKAAGAGLTVVSSFKYDGTDKAWQPTYATVTRKE